MKIKVIESFYDRENGMALRKIGDELEVPDARGKGLIGGGFAVEIKPGEERKRKYQ